MKNGGIEWIGEIPKEWHVGKVKQVFLKQNSKAMQDNPIILSLARSGIKVRDISNNEGQLAGNYYNYNPVKEGDFLLNPMDLYSGANCNVSKFEGVISPAYVNLRAKNSNVSYYYNYYFKTQYWAMALFAHGKGVSFENRWTLNNETIMNYFIPVPSQEEQQKIADYLDEKVFLLDSIITKTTLSIEEYKKYKQSLITETVTKGLNPNVEMKDSEIKWIGEIPNEWDITRVRYCCKLKNGTTPSTSETKYFNGNINWFTPSDFKSNFLLEKPIKTLSELTITEGIVTLYPKESILLICIGGTVGKIGYIDKNGYSNQQITALIPIDIYYKYLLYYLVSITEYIKCNALYTTLPIINISYLNDIPILTPSKTEQKQISQYLDQKCTKIDNIITQKQKLLAELESYKKSLIYECVTGKREVI